MNKIITIDVRCLSLSGMGTYLKNLIPGLVDDLPNYDFVLLGDPIELKKLFPTNITRVNIIASTSSIYSIREQIEYVRLIPKSTSLYFSTHYNIPLLYFGPMLVTVYDLCHLAMPQFLNGIHKRIYANIMFRAIRYKAKKIITISEFSKCELNKFTGIAKQNITSIPLGVDMESSTVKTDTPIYTKPYILFVGNVKPHKNLNNLVLAFSKILDKLPHNLVIVGKKDGFITDNKFDPRIIESLGDRIMFTGYVNDDDLKNYYTHADAFVFPSFYEGFGLPLLEAMAARCPVIASNVASIPEVCGDGAIYFDPYNADDIASKIVLTLSDKKLCSTLKDRGYNHALKYSWDNTIKSTSKVIKKLLEL